MAKIALIACVKKKLLVPSPAIELYNSTDFRSWVELANQTPVDAIYILSGKYGLLLPEQIIEPYDFNLNEANENYHSKWSAQVLIQLRERHNLEKDHFIFYTNHRYAELLISELNSFEFPIEIE
jgi:hypothetical protein